jgi:hypothetical protein
MLNNPLDLFRPTRIQTLLFIQPIDIPRDRRQNMCDGSSDVTVFNDELVWSCRLEEYMSFGMGLRSTPHSLQRSADKYV